MRGKLLLKKNGYIKRLLSLLIVLLIIIETTIPFYSQADASTPSYTVINSDGERVLTISMYDSIITIVAKSHKASTDIHWRTIGMIITREPITTTKTVKGYSGPGPVSDAYGEGKGELYVDDAIQKTETTSGDIVTTTFEFSKEQVENALKDDFSDITANTTIYFHGIFQTYNAKTGVILNNSTKGIKSWETIMKAQAWGSDTLGDFAKYYNIPISFQPPEKGYPNTLYYITQSGIKIGSEELDSVLPGETVSWSKKPAKKTYNNKSFELYKYYVTKKSDKTAKKIVTHYINDSDGCTLSDIRSNSTKVYLGGDNVYLVYKEIVPVITPTPAPTQKPGATATPEPTSTATPTPEPEDPETITAEINVPEAIGCIRADDRGSEKFTVNLGVPTTESLYTQVTSDQYLMGYTLQKMSGTQTYSVKVSKTYTLKWKGKDAKGSKTMTDTVTNVQYVSIKRAYSYWEILNFDYFILDNASITNYALPDGLTVMTPDYSAGYNVPSVMADHSASESSHIILPSEFTDGITLDGETITGGTSKPAIPAENLTSAADSILPDVNVKNDNLTINGTAVMSDRVTAKDGPEVDADYLAEIKSAGEEKCNENVMYKPNQIIKATKKNGTYETTGTITYKQMNGINSFYATTIPGNIDNLESVVIHTPVVCKPVVVADNNKYVQLLNPTSAVQLVLDPKSSLNDFTLQVSNTGPHSNKSGYYTRDFSRSLRDPDNVSYLASDKDTLLNEVKFPFDIYIEKSAGDEFIKKNTWIVLGRSTASFHIPMWVQEGTYTAICRSIAVNADMDNLDNISESEANTQLSNYVATNTIDFEVSGRVYGLTIYDLTDYPFWKEAFRVKDSLQLKINNQDKYPDGTDKFNYSKNYSYDYTVGTNDQYGNNTARHVKYTFPLVNGSHPYYTNLGVLKTGYMVRFKLNTIGTMYGSGCSVRIKPTFYYVDANGGNRTQVDLYYTEYFNGRSHSLVKVGSTLDKLNKKDMEAGSPYVGIPKEDIKNTISILNKKYAEFIYNRNNLFTFSQIDILSSFRTFVNKLYTNKIVNSDQYSNIKNTGVVSGDIMKQMQTWYGYYYLPTVIHAVNPNDVPDGWTVEQYAARKGISYHEDFWKKDGYIIVKFDIVTVDSAGNERLSYINADNYMKNGNCSMWVMEGAPLSKKDNKDVTFDFKAGDFIIYYANKSIRGDYSAGGIY